MRKTGVTDLVIASQHSEMVKEQKQKNSVRTKVPLCLKPVKPKLTLVSGGNVKVLSVNRG
jgi:hypothetical protein